MASSGFSSSLSNDDVGQRKLGNFGPFRFTRSTTERRVSKRVKFVFKLIPPPPLAKELANLILENGGSVLRNDSSGFTDYAVTILDEKYYIQHPNQDCTLPLDTFSSLYIWDFIRARRNDLPLPSMRAYRLTNTKYESFDVNKILAQKIKWTDLVVKENIGSHSSQTAQEQVKRLKSRKIKQLFEDEVNAKEIIKEAEDIPKSLPMSPLSKRNLKRSSKTESSTEEKPEGEIVNPNQRNLDSQRDEGMELTLTPPPKKQKLTEKPKLEEALATGDGSSISSKLTEETSSSPPKRSETDKEQQKKKTNVQIRLSPHPSTSAQVRSRLPIKFVPRELAGPKSIKSKLPEKKPVKVASTTNEPIKTSKDTDTTVEDDGEQAILEDGDDKSTIVDSDIGDAQSQTSEESRSRYKARPFASRKTPYTDGDGQLILDLICDNRAFLYTRGNRLWQQMADSDLFPGRTHQSLKEHYRKKVAPNALKQRIYRITPENLRRLQKAPERANWTKHANFCPDFNF